MTIKASRFPYHRRYHEDALRGFSMLTLEQRGAYQTILDLIYTSGGDIADNERWLAGQMMISVRKYRTIRDELVALGKIWIVDGMIGNPRAATEIENQKRIFTKIVEGGQRGGQQRAENARQETPRKSSENALKTSGKRDENPSKKSPENAETEAKPNEIKANAQAPLEPPLEKKLKHPDPEPRPHRDKPSLPSSTPGGRPSPLTAAGPPGVADSRAAPAPDEAADVLALQERARDLQIEQLRKFADAEAADAPVGIALAASA